MEKQYVLLLVSIPIVWFTILLSYKIIILFILWVKYKFENIKIKEINLWD